MKKENLRLLFVTVLAVVLFAPMFLLRELGGVDFWWWMTVNLVILVIISALLFKDYMQDTLADMGTKFFNKLVLGVLSAAVLYFVFYIGNHLSNLMFQQASGEISSIYAFKGDASRLRIFILMLMVIGPGEELFWRGFLQKKFMERMKPVYGFLLAAAIYTSVHVLTGNFMLVMAAMVAGLFWGWMYMRYRSITANMISHIVWDIVIFLILPIS